MSRERLTRDCSLCLETTAIKSTPLMPALPVEIIARILSNLVDPIVPLHKSKDSIYLPLDLVNATQVWPREGKRWLREVVRIRSSEGARKFMEGLLMEREQEELDDENDDERIEQLEDEHGAVHGKPIRVRQLEFCGAGDEDNGQRLAELLSYCTGLDGLWLMETRLKSNVRDFAIDSLASLTLDRVVVDVATERLATTFTSLQTLRMTRCFVLWLGETPTYSPGTLGSHLPFIGTTSKLKTLVCEMNQNRNFDVHLGLSDFVGIPSLQESIENIRIQSLDEDEGPIINQLEPWINLKSLSIPIGIFVQASVDWQNSMQKINISSWRELIVYDAVHSIQSPMHHNCMIGENHSKYLTGQIAIALNEVLSMNRSLDRVSLPNYFNFFRDGAFERQGDDDVWWEDDEEVGQREGMVLRVAEICKMRNILITTHLQCETGLKY